jgi:hypothetical protein
VEAPEITRFSVDWKMEYEEKPGNKSEFLDMVNLAIVIIVHHYLRTTKLDFSYFLWDYYQSSCIVNEPRPKST